MQDYWEQGRHHRVEGWLDDGAAAMVVALGRVQERMAIAGGVAEIGVHHSRLLILLYLISRPGERALAIDLFSQQQLNVDRSGAGNRDALIANLERHADTERVVLWEADSTTLSGEDVIAKPGSRIRLFSIDGEHSPEITIHDLTMAPASLASGGGIILNDCFNESWPGASEGTYRFFAQPRGVVPFAVGSDKTLFCAPEFVDNFKAELGGLATKTVAQPFLGQSVLCLNFKPLSFAERIGDLSAWIAIKDMPSIAQARRLYRTMEAH